MQLNMHSPMPSKPNHLDSLIFSITAQKNLSDRSENLLKNSYENNSDALQEIALMGRKINGLESRLRSIKDDSLFVHDEDDATHHWKQQDKQNIDITNVVLGERSKSKNRGKSGAIRQVKPRNGNSSFNITLRNNCSFSNQSKVSLKSYQSQISEKQNQIKNFKKELLKMRMKVQRSSRSQSKSLQKLSQSKSKLRNLENIKKANEKIITNLALNLRKSENIRKRQKQTITKQKRQIQELRKMLIAIKKQNRVSF